MGVITVRAGLHLAVRGATAAEKSMQGALAIERGLLEKRLSYLGTLGNNAPFVGLFGTVIGVIFAFEALGDAGAAGAGQMASKEVMSAIAEALVATAVGIAVALPAVVLNNYFYRRIEGIMSEAEALSSFVVAYLVDGAPPHPETHQIIPKEPRAKMSRTRTRRTQAATQRTPAADLGPWSA